MKEVGFMDKMLNAAILLRYMKDNGFNENNYDKILEIISGIDDSLSQFLFSKKTFLLSKKATLDNLKNSNVNGACGCLTKNGIYIPGTFSTPKINDFGAIIGNGVGIDLSSVWRFKQEKFLGLCTDTGNEIDKEVYEILKETINYNSDIEYMLYHDTISNMKKDVLLVAPRQKVKVKVLLPSKKYGKK